MAFLTERKNPRYPFYRSTGGVIIFLRPKIVGKRLRRSPRRYYAQNASNNIGTSHCILEPLHETGCFNFTCNDETSTVARGPA
jgi:hypothetical protein